MINKSKLFAKIALLVFLISMFIIGCKNTSQNSTEPQPNDNIADTDIEISPHQGYLAPDFELEDLSGENIKLSNLRGKTVVLNFWSLGCKYCLQEMPDFDEFNRTKTEDMVVLMINLDKDRSRLSAYIENQGYGFTVLKDEKGETARNYLIRAIPATFVIDKDGVVRHRAEGPLTLENLNNLTADEAIDNSIIPN